MRKTTPVTIGKIYYTHVAQTVCQVEVIGDKGGRGRRWLVKRVDNGLHLKAPRAGSGLHETPGPWS